LGEIGRKGMCGSDPEQGLDGHESSSGERGGREQAACRPWRAQRRRRGCWGGRWPAAAGHRPAALRNEKGPGRFRDPGPVVYRFPALVPAAVADVPAVVAPALIVVVVPAAAAMPAVVTVVVPVPVAVVGRLVVRALVDDPRPVVDR